MGLFPKVVLALCVSGAVSVPFMSVFKKSNGHEYAHPNLSAQSSVITGLKTDDSDGRQEKTTYTRLMARQNKKKKKTRRKPLIRIGREPVQLGKKTLRIIRDSKPPEIKVITPKDPSYVMTDWLTIRATSEAGARLNVGRSPLLETSKGIFVGKTKLMPGKNTLTIIARDPAGNTSQKTIEVTRINEDKVHQAKNRLNALLSQLNEIQSISQEIDVRTKDLIREANNTQDADTINRLSREQQEILKTKLTIQAEIEQAIKHIDELIKMIK